MRFGNRALAKSVLNRLACNPRHAVRAVQNPKEKAKEPAVAVFDTSACEALIEGMTAIAARAAAAIRQRGATSLHHKADGSPVTTADQAAEAVILQDLKRLAPGIPIVSEERSGQTHAGTRDATYFLVDPLDGTREFIAGRDEFTVNIALINLATPLMGIIAAPAADLAWRGIVGRGAERVRLADQSGRTAIRTRPRSAHPVIMISRSHLDADTKAYLAGVAQASAETSGSSIKFCRIAEGTADLYPRLAPTHDWDVAAGHALVLAAGGNVRAADGSPLVYGTPKRLIPDFIARGDPRQG
jgi:3'(2'), 5'-bisphosphate nucleotidase